MLVQQCIFVALTTDSLDALYKGSPDMIIMILYTTFDTLRHPILLELQEQLSHTSDGGVGVGKVKSIGCYGLSLLQNFSVHIDKLSLAIGPF